ncbi:hypothetical protein GGI02_004016 [Coemansia sp. RSA 2322]|nr:hypothetical protein GGI02_004016 [Coemansia sp. RSA 2322]
MLGLGALGLATAISVHFGVYQKLSDDPSRARSITRLVTSVLTLVAFALLIWVLVRSNKILRQTRMRDFSSSSPATFAPTTYKTSSYRQTPPPTIHYMLSMQQLAFITKSGKLLAIVLFVRSLCFIIFDISYLTPDQVAVQTLASSSVLTGIGTLASSLVSACIVQVLFPRRFNVLADIFSSVSELDPSAHLAFFGVQQHRGAGINSASMPAPRLAPSMSSDGRGNSRSRAPTSASLAVEKLLSRSVSRDKDRLDQSFTMAGGDNYNDEDGNYLQHIPYIDRNARENSFFALGPWSQPVTKTLTPQAPLSPNPSTVHQQQPASELVLPSSQGLEQLVRSNSGIRVISNEARRDIISQSPPVFQDDFTMPGGPGSNNQEHSEVPVQTPPFYVRSQVLSAYVPLSSSNVALYESDLSAGALNSSTPISGPSLHGQALDDSHTELDRPDSLVSCYIRADNSYPMFRNVLKNERTSSFVSDDYQYEPAGPGDGNGGRTGGGSAQSRSNPFEAHSSPLALRPAQTMASERPAVYIAQPTGVSDLNGSDEADDGLGSGAMLQEGGGPILIHKGSKASLRRKNTIERRKRLGGGELLSPSSEASANSSQASGFGSNVAVDGGELSPAKAAMATLKGSGSKDALMESKKAALKASRMSAFTSTGAASPTHSLPGGDPLPVAEPRRDSSTISTISWGNKSKHASEVSVDMIAVNGNAVRPQHSMRGALSGSAVGAGMRVHRMSQESVNGSSGGLPLEPPAATFKHSFSSSNHEYSSGGDVFSSLSSLHTMGTHDAFYTPESSMAQMQADKDTAFVPETEEEFAERPATAPTVRSQQQRHTMAAAGERPAEPGLGEGGDSLLLASAAGVSLPNAALRRVQTLRKAVATDAPALESSIQAPTEEETAGALISALPMPNSLTSPGGRVIL